MRFARCQLFDFAIIFSAAALSIKTAKAGISQPRLDEYIGSLRIRAVRSGNVTDA